jgi:hypothetical protein
MAHTLTITTSDENVIQDVENFVTSLYQRGVALTHETVMEEVTEPSTKEVPAATEFPEETTTKSSGRSGRSGS